MGIVGIGGNCVVSICEMKFDGKKFAEEILKDLPRVHRKLAVVVDPSNLTGMKYVEMKKKVAKRLGVEFEITDFKSAQSADAIMIQLPYPNSEELIKQIDPKKDVDGLREDSLYKPAVVRAVLEIIKPYTGEVVVVGSRGFVGSRLVKELRCVGIDKEDFDPSTLLRADVIICCTGQEGVINGSMVKNGFVAIDVGYPKAEFTEDALAKASFYTPVPGGVGPVTVAMLFKNLLGC